MTILKKFERLNSVATKLFLIQVVIAICALLANVLSARTLGPEARGQLGLYMQIAYVANAFSVLGRHRSYLKQQSKPLLALETTFSDIRNLSIAPLFLSVLIGLVCGFLFGNSSTNTTLLALGFITLIYSGVQQKNYRSAAILAKNATPYFWSSISGQILMLIILSILTLTDNKYLPLWLLVYGFSVVLPYFLLSTFVLLKRSSKPSPKRSLLETKRLGLKLVPMSTAEIIGARIDRFLLPSLAGFAQLGIYTVVATMTELIAWPIKNYTDSKVPHWSREISAGRLRLGKEISGMIISIAILSILVGIFLEITLIPLFGAEYSSGKQLIWPLVIAAGLHGWNHFGTNICLAAGLNALANSIPTAAMVFSTITYLLLIPSFGALGASWGLICGYFLSGILSILGIVRTVRLNKNSLQL